MSHIRTNSYKMPMTTNIQDITYMGIRPMYNYYRLLVHDKYLSDLQFILILVHDSNTVVEIRPLN